MSLLCRQKSRLFRIHLDERFTRRLTLMSVRAKLNCVQLDVALPVRCKPYGRLERQCSWHVRPETPRFVRLVLHRVILSGGCSPFESRTAIAVEVWVERAVDSRSVVAAAQRFAGPYFDSRPVPFNEVAIRYSTSVTVVTTNSKANEWQRKKKKMDELSLRSPRIIGKVRTCFRFESESSFATHIERCEDLPKVFKLDLTFLKLLLPLHWLRVKFRWD